MRVDAAQRPTLSRCIRHLPNVLALLIVVFLIAVVLSGHLVW